MRNWLDQLPHRDPFRFVSRVIEVKPGTSATGIWSITGNEAFFAGHFPGMPIVPGVLITEALAQISGLVGPEDSGPEGKLAHVDMRFDKAISPPAEIELHSRMVRVFGSLQQFDVEALVSGRMIARGTLTLHRPAK